MQGSLTAQRKPESRFPALNRANSNRSSNVVSLEPADSASNGPVLYSQPIIGQAAHIRPHISAYPASAPSTDTFYYNQISLPSVAPMPKRRPYHLRVPRPKPQLKQETMLTIPQAKRLLAIVNRDYRREISRDIFHYKKKPEEELHL